LELNIEKLVFGGDGLARLPADERGHGKTVFLPYVIPGERVDATVVESHSGYARARLNQIVTRSADRVVPGCQYFGRCGGCQYQHIEYEAQLRFKADILRDTLRRTAKLELPNEIQLHASEPWGYRNRTRVRVQHDPAFALGYFLASSHKLLPVQSCPISSPLINQCIGGVWELGRSGRAPNTVHGMQFFANHDETRVLIEVYVDAQAPQADCGPFATALMDEARAAVIGVVVYASSLLEDETRQLAPLSSAHNGHAFAIGAGHLVYQAVGHDYQVSRGSFFQTNRFLIDELARVAIGDVRGDVALDLYAGAGLFTLPLAASFRKVTAVEASPRAIADLKHNAPANVRVVQGTTQSFLSQEVADLRPEFILLDPPRAGVGKEATKAMCRTSASRVTYVSCDPATLARDLRVLLESGFTVEQAHLFDLFPQTAHMETVLHLAR
jgi:23S rRNA (uracil1939-C5)-methyltransferase